MSFDKSKVLGVLEGGQSIVLASDNDSIKPEVVMVTPREYRDVMVYLEYENIKFKAKQEGQKQKYKGKIEI